MTYYDQKTLGKIYIDNEKKHPVAISASDMELIQELITANRVFGNGEVYTREQLQDLRDEPTLRNKLSLVVSKFSVTSSNSKTIPSEIKRYGRNGVALDGRDKFRDLRNHNEIPKKRYRHKSMKEIKLVVEEMEKKLFKDLAAALDLSMNQTILTLALPLAREMKAELEKGDPEGKVVKMMQYTRYNRSDYSRRLKSRGSDDVHTAFSSGRRDSGMCIRTSRMLFLQRGCASSARSCLSQGLLCTLAYTVLQNRRS